MINPRPETGRGFWLRLRHLVLSEGVAALGCFGSFRDYGCAPTAWFSQE